MFWILSVSDGEHDGNSIGPFNSKDEAVDHAMRTTAEWADWDIAQMQVVHIYRYKESV